MDFRGVEEYLFRLWFSSGIHHHYGSEKFEPHFSEAYLRSCIEELQRSKGQLLRFRGRELDELLAVVFDPEREPRRTVQSGEGRPGASFFGELSMLPTSRKPRPKPSTGRLMTTSPKRSVKSLLLWG